MTPRSWQTRVHRGHSRGPSDPILPGALILAVGLSERPRDPRHLRCSRPRQTGTTPGVRYVQVTWAPWHPSVSPRTPHTATASSTRSPAPRPAPPPPQPRVPRGEHNARAMLPERCWCCLEVNIHATVLRCDDDTLRSAAICSLSYTGTDEPVHGRLRVVTRPPRRVVAVGACARRTAVAPSPGSR
jgi:hypothetical protein